MVNMLFNSVEFLIFFPIVCIGYFLIPQKGKNTYLLTASYYFYMCWNPKYALLMLLSTVITYLSGILIVWAKSTRKFSPRAVVAVSFILNLAILFFFKYFNFFAENVNRLLAAAFVKSRMPSLDLVLPVGISFYTFQALSYTMDVYRGEIEEEKNFINYALFVSFFPQLVAGPIERSKNLLSQVHAQHHFDFDNMRAGLLQMLYGYFQKIVISETAAIVVSEVYGNYQKYPGAMICVATIFFALQIYCDFGGYSNIARGAARIMGFSLMENFHNPYFADSVADFWRRWHISLSTWFKDYLYIPLGGNRKGRGRKYLNLMIVFLTSGLWHGANWTYVVWGGLNGLFQIIGDLLRPAREKLVKLFRINKKSYGYRLSQILITFSLVDFTWLFFRADNIQTAFAMIRLQFTSFQIWTLLDGTLYTLGLTQRQMDMFVVSLVILLAVDLSKEWHKNVIDMIWREGIVVRWILYMGLLYYILIFGIYGPMYDASQFLYFQF